MNERLYKTRSGVIFDDVFSEFLNLQSYMLSDAASVALATDGLTIQHHPTQDVRVLRDIPPGMGAAEVTLSYAPTLPGDKGGFMLFDNSANTAQLLEYADDIFSDLTSIKIKKRADVFDFFMKHTEFLHIDSVQFPFTKMGFVAKVGDASFEPLCIARFLCTTSDEVIVENVEEGFVVEFTTTEGMQVQEADVTGRVVFLMTHLEQRGTIRIIDQDNGLVSEVTDVFYGGDTYTFGSYLILRRSGEELSTLTPNVTTNNLGRITNQGTSIKLELFNPNDVAAFDVHLRVNRYVDTFGYEWVDIALDADGSPGDYTDSLHVPVIQPLQIVEFWVKLERNNVMNSSSMMYFTLDLTHE